MARRRPPSLAAGRHRHLHGQSRSGQGTYTGTNTNAFDENQPMTGGR
jgi:hypothetical protein